MASPWGRVVRWLRQRTVDRGSMGKGGQVVKATDCRSRVHGEGWSGG